jgi:3'(2'), 5'-bisphosphate nucleotidase
MGSALKFCLVAAGDADVYPRLTPSMEWDIAAGCLIAREAGCRIRPVPASAEITFNKQALVNPGFVVERARE